MMAAMEKSVALIARMAEAGGAAAMCWWRLMRQVSSSMIPAGNICLTSKTASEMFAILRRSSHFRSVDTVVFDIRKLNESQLNFRFGCSSQFETGMSVGALPSSLESSRRSTEQVGHLDVAFGCFGWLLPRPCQNSRLLPVWNLEGRSRYSRQWRAGPIRPSSWARKWEGAPSLCHSLSLFNSRTHSEAISLYRVVAHSLHSIELIFFFFSLFFLSCTFLFSAL